MKKMKLDWDALDVESFETADAPSLRGTVQGNASYVWEGCLTETNENSCPGSCEPATCDDLCTTGTGTSDEPTERGPSCVMTSPWGNTCCQAEC
jgi:hypothetical protein